MAKSKNTLPTALEAALNRLEGMRRAAVEKSEFANIDADNTKIKNKNTASIRRLHDLYFSVFRPHAYDSETNTWRKWKYGERAKIYRQVKAEAGERFQFLRNLFASRMAMKHSYFRSTRGIIKDQYGSGVFPSMRKPTNSPYNKYDFVGKDKTRYDTNWAYNEAPSSPTGLDFFPPVTEETARSMRAEDEDARARKHNRYTYLRRQAARRQRIFDEYKWLKPIAKANPTIAKNLPKIAKRLDAIGKIPGGSMLTHHPALVAAGLAWGTINKFFDVQSRLQQRRILEGYYGTPSDAMRNAMFATGIGYNAAAKTAGDFAALRSQLQHGEGLGAIMRAAKYGLTSVTAMMDPLLSDDQVLKIVAEDAKRMDVGERINALSSVGISSEMYSAGLKIGKREEELPLEDFISLRSKQFENWLAGTSAGRTVDNIVGGMWLTPINKLLAVGEYMAQRAPYGDAPKPDSLIDNGIRKLFGIDKPLAEAAAKSLDANPMPLAEAAAKSLDANPMPLAEAAAKSLDANPMPLAEAAAKSLDASNARATDADVAAITNYNTTERPVTVVIQGDIRTDASNGEALYNDIEKTYGVDFLTGIAQPVANAFDSKRVR